MQHKETVAYLIRGCSKLAATDYTERHNSVAAVVHREICPKYNLESNKEWWVEPEKVWESKQTEILLDFPVQTDVWMPLNRHDIILIDHQKKTGSIIDIAVPRDENTQDKKMKILTNISL